MWALRLALPATRGGWALLVTSALGGFVLFPVLFTLGLRDTSASHAALILASLAVFPMLGSLGGALAESFDLVSGLTDQAAGTVAADDLRVAESTL